MKVQRIEGAPLGLLVHDGDGLSVLAPACQLTEQLGLGDD